MKTFTTGVLSALIVATTTTTTNAQFHDGVGVHLFEWSWNDIANECEQFLGPKGYTHVQISPPMEHIQGEQWWTRYQPVSYNLTQSRSGTEDELMSMIKTCNKAGVDIVADAVINHMAAGSGTGTCGNDYGNRQYAYYGPDDFHHNDGDSSKNCVVSNYNNKHDVQYCDLVTLPDLCTECQYVQEKIAGYLQYLAKIGVKGFRIDAAKHIDRGDLRSILEKGPKLSTFQEVISGGGEPVTPFDYVSIGQVTEFNYHRTLKSLVGGANAGTANVDMSQIVEIGKGFGLVDSRDAVIFIDNHDTQRNDDHPAIYKDGQLYEFFNIVMLSLPYGWPKVMSSYYFDDSDQGPPKNGVYNRNDDVNCGNSDWVCEHRWDSISNMVQWRNVAGKDGDESIDNVFSDYNAHVAFSRNQGKAFIALNRDDNNSWDNDFQTGLKEGNYCNIIISDDTDSCDAIYVDGNGQAQLNVPSLGAIALHVNAMKN